MAVTASEVSHGALDPRRLRADFPALVQEIHGQPLVYLDNAATTQKPNAVIDAVSGYYRRDNANVHRGVHTLSERATTLYETARTKVAGFIGAGANEEIVFLRGATEAINLVAGSWGAANIGADDEILLTELEHHSNILPWQLLAERVGAKIVVAPMDKNGNVPIRSWANLLNPRTKLAAFAHVSNALGTVNPVAEMTALAHKAGVKVLVDGAQAAGHLPVSVAEIGCDFYALSAHKMYGPMGIGTLYVRREIAAGMPPWQGGGEMIRAVRFERSLYADPPQRFEAGTPNVAGAIGLGAAIEYLETLDMRRLAEREDALIAFALDRLAAVEGLHFVGEPERRAGVISFTLADVHPHDLGTLLDHAGIAVRTGHHCAMPVMEHYGVPATVRASFGLYNTEEDAEKLATALGEAKGIFGR